MNNTSSVLGLFPQFGNGHLGGIQASADAAWEAVSASAQVTLISYRRPAHGAKAEVNTAYTRLQALLGVLRQTKPVDLLLIWQIGLLKLLPFFPSRPRNVVLFLHGIEVWKKQDWLTQQLLKRVGIFLTNSDYTWERFLSYNPGLKQSRHKTVWLGLDASLSADSGSPYERPIALMLSRLSKGEDYKGHREVINAWPEVLQQTPDAALWIAGDGDLRTDLEQLVAELGLEHSVRFWGQVSEEKKQELLQQSRCLAMPSRGEGFGLVYLEAMRLGRPCLVSTLDAGREVIDPPEAGLAVDPDNQSEVASAICRLLADGPEWQQWSTQARRRYEENFTARHFQERLLTALFPIQSIPETTTTSRLSELSNV